MAQTADGTEYEHRRSSGLQIAQEFWQKFNTASVRSFCNFDVILFVILVTLAVMINHWSVDGLERPFPCRRRDEVKIEKK
jgi:hypothetical protein